MTADVIPGPPCDGCGNEFAVMSLLSYADYSQVKVGLNCAPNFLRSIADSMDGKTSAEPDDQAAESETDPYESSAGSEPNAEPEPPEPDDEPGSARDHWASTTNVRRSTHGHRRTSSATGRPPESEPAS